MVGISLLSFPFKIVATTPTATRFKFPTIHYPHKAAEGNINFKNYLNGLINLEQPLRHKICLKMLQAPVHTHLDNFSIKRFFSLQIF